MFSNDFDKFAKKVEKISGTNNVSMDALLTPGFMAKHTKFSDFGQLLEAGGFDGSSQEAFEAIDEEKLDAHISAHSSFASWAEMKARAGELWVKSQLGLS